MAVADDFTLLTCYDCGIEFAVPFRWARVRAMDKRPVYCPNGHGQALRNMDELASDDRDGGSLSKEKPDLPPASLGVY